MRIGILTYQSALNYGALYQMYALFTYLSQSYTDCNFEVIDYQSPYLQQYYSVKNQISNNLFSSAVRTFNFIVKRSRFRSFISGKIQLSSQSYNIDNIDTANATYDLFIAGSDQIWNPCITDNDLNYYLKFVDSHKRASYAASIGLAEIPQPYLEQIKRELSMFRTISVREDASKEYLQTFLSGVSVRSDIDPTLLLKTNEWEKVVESLPKKKPYVLLFEVKYSYELLSQAVEFAKKRDLDVIYIGPYKKNGDVKYIPFPHPEHVLSYFKDASYVFTNSFHGTVFSIIFKKLFYTLAELNDGRNNRITDLLTNLSLTDRMNLHLLESSIDWDSVGNELDLLRERAREYFDGVINNGRRKN